MERQTILQIAILANDVGKDGKTLGAGTKARCDCALEHISKWFYQIPCSTAAVAVFIYIAAGKGGRWVGETTLAQAMEDYLRECLGTRALDCVFVTNQNAEEVWSTLAEMKWIFSEIDKLNWSFLSRRMIFEKVRFVTNQVHARRVSFIKRHFFAERQIGDFCLSWEAYPPWWHERCAYVKLAFYYLGFGAFFEPWRRRYYSG